MTLSRILPNDSSLLILSGTPLPPPFLSFSHTRAYLLAPIALRHLSASLLKRQIQQGGSSGHCSEEDAAAALILAVRRARIGPSFALRDPSRPKNIFDEVATVREGSNSAVSIASTAHSGPGLRRLAEEACHQPHEWRTCSEVRFHRFGEDGCARGMANDRKTQSKYFMGKSCRHRS